MTILMFNTLYYPSKVGGAEKSVQLLAEDLVQMGHKVVVACLTNKRDDVFVHNGVKVYKLLHKNIYWAYEPKKRNANILQKMIWHSIDIYTNSQRRNIKKILSTENPQLVHVNNISGFSSGILKTFKNNDLPIVQTLRDYYYLCYKNTCYDNGNCYKLCKACEITSKYKLKNLNLYPNHIVGISQFIVKKHQKHGLDKAKPSQIIYNAVGKSKTPTFGKNKGSKKIIFGFIGSVTPAKGIEDMLELFSRDSLKPYDFQINIAGKGNFSYINMLKNKYTSLNIEFLGFQKAELFYQNIDALIIPSQWNEPFGRVVIEGAQYNLPIFVSRNGALPELKKELHLVEWFEEKAILEFLKHKDELSYNYDLSRFRSKIISQEYEELFLKLVKHEN